MLRVQNDFKVNQPSTTSRREAPALLKDLSSRVSSLGAVRRITQ